VFELVVNTLTSTVTYDAEAQTAALVSGEVVNTGTDI